MINYLAQQKDSGVSSEDLHKARAAMSRMTPLGEGVDASRQLQPEPISRIRPRRRRTPTTLTPRGTGNDSTA